MEHITTNNDSIKLSETIGGASIPQDEDLRILTYKTLLERFNTKHSNLNYPQKSLLRAYINNVSNTNSLKETLPCSRFISTEVLDLVAITSLLSIAIVNVSFFILNLLYI